MKKRLDGVGVNSKKRREPDKKYSAVVYIATLFTVTLLLILLSWFIHQRKVTENISDTETENISYLAESYDRH